MNTDDPRDRLIDAAFTYTGPGPVPVDRQLLSDAYSAINRLAAEVVRYNRDGRADREMVYELTWQLRDEKVARASEVARLRAELAAARAAHRRDLEKTADRRRRDHAAASNYRAAVGRLPVEVRRRRTASTVVAPALTDTQLLELTLTAINRANRAYATDQDVPAMAAVAQHPEGMTA
jgi:hypothetical protein